MEKDMDFSKVHMVYKRRVSLKRKVGEIYKSWYRKEDDTKTVGMRGFGGDEYAFKRYSIRRSDEKYGGGKELNKKIGKESLDEYKGKN